MALALCIGMPLIAAVPAAADQTPPATGPVHEAARPVADQYIVTLRDTTAANVPAKADDVARRYHATVFEVYQHALRGFAARMSAVDATQLAADPAVAAVEQDGVVAIAASPETPVPSWGLDRIDQVNLPLDNSYSYASTASTVHAYVIDTGVHFTNTDFGGRATLGVDEVSPSTGGDDCNGHGTHVAGTIGGATYGVAKSVQLVSVRVLNCSGSGTFSQVIAGVDWVSANAIKPAVANMSLGGSLSPALDTSVQNSINSGVVYAVAAGNGSTDACSSSPADVAQALTVGATDINDARASFSNFGPCVDLFAPGVNITSDWNTSDTATNVLSGTSMATPHVTGAAALYLAASPCATEAEVASALTANASGVVTNLGTGSPNLLLDTGFIAAQAPARAPCAPTASATAGIGTVHLAWGVPADAGGPITAYNVSRSTTPGGEALLTTLGPGATTYNDTIAAGVTYYYTVTATNVQGTSSANELVATPGPTLTATAAKLGAHLSWSIPSGVSPPVTGFSVYRGTAPGAESSTPIAQVGAGVTSYDDTGLSSSQSYYYEVGATQTSETRSNEQSVTPLPPSAPSSPVLSVTSGNSRAHLTWTPPADTGGAPLTGYNVYRGTTSNPQTLLTTGGPLPASQTSYDDSGLTDGTTYFYAVTALNSINGAGEGSPSNVASATPTAALDAFVRGSDNGVWWRHDNGPTWSAWAPLGGVVTSDVATVSGSGKVWIFARGADNALWFRTYDGTSWSPWLAMGGVIGSNATAAFDGANVRVFVRGTDGALYTALIHDTTVLQNWRGLGGVVVGDPAVTWDGSAFAVVVRGGDNGAYMGLFTGTSTWSNWAPLGGVLASDPAVVFDGSLVRVFVRGGDDHLYVGSGAPFAWTGLGGVINAAPAAATNGAGYVRVFVRGADNTIYTRDSSGSSWPGDFQGIGNTATSPPAATWNGAGAVAFVRGGDSGMWTGAYSSIWQGWNSLGGILSSSVRVAATP
jgi:subtilisin family serine protease